MDSDPNNDAEHGGRIAGYDMWESGKRLGLAGPQIRDATWFLLKALRTTHTLSFRLTSPHMLVPYEQPVVVLRLLVDKP